MDKLNLVIVSGSHRKNSESGKVVEYIKNTILENFNNEFAPETINLANEYTPFYEDDLAKNDSLFEKSWKTISQKLNNADAFVIVSPEWNGMVPAKLKNLFLLVDKEFYHKPAFIVTVSASFGGHYPVAELRMSSYKNSRICYIPEHLIIRRVEQFNKDPKNKEFADILERLQNNLHMLYRYGTRLKGIGQEILNQPLTKKNPNGM